MSIPIRNEFIKALMQFPMPHRGCAHHQGTVGDGVGDTGVFFRAGQQLRRANRGARRTECLFVGVHHPELGKPEIAHGACRRANVKWIT